MMMTKDEQVTSLIAVGIAIGIIVVAAVAGLVLAIVVVSP